MNDDIPLKWCPFCGGLATMIEWREDKEPNLRRFFVRCAACDIVGPWSYIRRVAVAKWNNRVER